MKSGILSVQSYTDLELFTTVAEQTHAKLTDGKFKTNACIAATKIVCDVLAPLGFNVEPLPCMVQAWNPAWTAFVESHGRQPEGEHEITPDMWSVGIGMGFVDKRDADFGLHPGKSYNGHLVACVNKQWLIDPSITQANRENHRMHFAPMALPIHGPRHERKRFFRGTGPMIYCSDDRQTLVYMAQEDKSYQLSPDWCKPRNVELYEQFANEIRSNLYEPTET